MGKFNDIFRKDVTYDKIKSHKKADFHVSLEDAFLEKPQGRSNCAKQSLEFPTYTQRLESRKNSN